MEVFLKIAKNMQINILKKTPPKCRKLDILDSGNEKHQTDLHKDLSYFYCTEINVSIY